MDGSACFDDAIGSLRRERANEYGGNECVHDTYRDNECVHDAYSSRNDGADHARRI